MFEKDVPTPHIEAKKDEIAKIVIMPGDPLRAEFIANKYLTNPKKVNSVRGMLAFTGNYKGVMITIMGHGMGIPSIGIYSYELYKFYDVELILRVGSCGSYFKEIPLKSIIMVEWAASYSNYAQAMGLKLKTNIIGAKQDILDNAKQAAKNLNVSYFTGLVNSSDAFYGVNNGPLLDLLLKQNKVLAVEMEAYALYVNARLLNKTALTFLTVSDSLVTSEEMTSEERRTSFIAMIELALETAITWDGGKK